VIQIQQFRMKLVPRFRLRSKSKVALTV